MFKFFLKSLAIAILLPLGIDLIIYLAVSFNFASFKIVNWSEEAREGFALIAGFKMLASVGLVLYVFLMNWAKDNVVDKNFRGYANSVQSTDIILPPPTPFTDIRWKLPPPPPPPPTPFVVQEIIDAIQSAILANPILTINNGETYLIGSFAITRNCIHFENAMIACDDRLGSTASRAWKIAQNTTSGTLKENYLKTFGKNHE